MQVVFSLPEYYDFSKEIVNSLFHASEGVIKRTPFPDGELGLQIVSKVRDQDVILVGATWDNASTMQIFDLGCAISKYGARSLTLVIPYFGCSTMERATYDGDVVTAKTRARLLSAIPQTHAGNRALLLDLHNEGIPYYFEGNLTATHVYAKPAIQKAVEGIAAENGFALRDCVLASTDAGRAKWVESLSNDMGITAAFIIKRRESGSSTKTLAVSADVKGKFVVIYDDMIRTGGSLLGAVKAYLDAGAAGVAAVATHGVLPGDSLANLYETGLFAKIVVTDSHPKAISLKKAFSYCATNFFDVVPVADLFVPFLKDSHG